MREMEITVSEEELGIICEALQRLEAERDVEDEEKLKSVRKLFQRLQVLHTAK